MTVIARGPVDVAIQRSRSPLRRGVRLVAHQVHYDLLSLVRNRTAQGFAFAMPISFLVLFVAIFGNGSLPYLGLHVRGSTYYVAALSVFGIVDVAFMALLISLVEVRELGVLRRRRATPQPAWTIIAGRAAVATLTGTASAALLLAIGRVAYGASVPPDALPALAVSVLVGAVAFCCLGFAAAGFVHSFQAAQPMAMALALPLLFISGVFIPWSIVPPWLHHVADVFPVRPLAVMVLNPFLAHGGRSAWDPEGMAVVGGWGLVALIVAVRRFKWAPQDV